MKIIEISYSLSRKLQFEQYQPIEFFAAIKAEIGSKDNIDKTFAELKKIVAEQINKDIELVRKRKQELSDKEKYPHGQCPTCEHPLARSREGNPYCPYSFSDDPNNPHKTKQTLTPNEEKFLKGLK